MKLRSKLSEIQELLIILSNIWSILIIEYSVKYMTIMTIIGHYIYFGFWPLFSLLSILMIFSEINFFMRFAVTYASIVSYIIFAFIINTASSIAFEALKAYKLLNSHLLKNFGKDITASQRVKV